MTTIAVILFWSVVALVVGQGALVLGFVAALRRWRRPLLEDRQLPKAAIVLCLRGGDPFLQHCLAGLRAQDYPRYTVHVIVDHPDDPAHALVQQFLQQQPIENLYVQFLREPRSACSLKCSSLVQAVESLDGSYDFVAQVDADTIPHATWLRELASALADERVGAATGNRWYMPAQPSWGSLIRYAWNAAAVVQMYWYGIAWGGTLAVKTRVLRETGLLEKWSQAFCEDTMLYGVLKRARLRVAFVPSLLMVNREDCDVGSFYHWVRRQLLTARLYHPAWWAVVSHGLATTLVSVGAVVWLALALAAVDRSAASWSVAALISYQLAMIMLLMLLEWAVRSAVRGRCESTNWMTLGICWRIAPAMVATQFVYAAALLSACLVRVVSWRGLSYRVDGPWQIELLEYRPFVERSPPGGQQSL